VESTASGGRFSLSSEKLLGEMGFQADPGQVIHEDGHLVFFHFTHRRHVDVILAPGSGLFARLQGPWVGLNAQESDPYICNGLLGLSPHWLDRSPYFGTLGQEMFRAYVGDVPMRIRVPVDFPNVWVSDWAHVLECKHFTRRGTAPLGLGYDCRTGRDSIAAMFRSRIPLSDYRGGHLAPVIEVVREGPGLVVPSKYLSLAD